MINGKVVVVYVFFRSLRSMPWVAGSLHACVQCIVLRCLQPLAARMHGVVLQSVAVI